MCANFWSSQYRVYPAGVVSLSLLDYCVFLLDVDIAVKAI